MSINTGTSTEPFTFPSSSIQDIFMEQLLYGGSGDGS